MIDDIRRTTYSEQVGMSFAEVEAHHGRLSAVDALWKLQHKTVLKTHVE